MVAGSTEMESFHFRNFREVIKKYGELQPEKPKSLLTIMANRRSPKVDSPHPTLRSDMDENTKQLDPKMKKWAKIHPEK